MSKRGVLRSTDVRRSVWYVMCTALLLFLLVPLTTASAQTSVRIGQSWGLPVTTTPGEDFVVPVILDSLPSPESWEAFDFLIGFDTSAMTLNDVTIGDDYLPCDWNFLSWRMDEDTASVAWAPSGLARIVMVVDLRGPDPLCNIEFDGVLVDLHFTASSAPGLAGMTHPIRFFWQDCPNNIFTAVGGLVILDPYDVYDMDTLGAGYHPITDSLTGFPTFTGPQALCHDTGSWDPIKAFDFYNGAVTFMPGGDTLLPSAQVKIDTATTSLGDSVEVAIRFDSTMNGFSAGGFDLLMGYDAAALAFTGAAPGEGYEDCEWEYFTYRYGPISAPDCDSTCPSGLVRVVAIGETNNGVHHPLCYLEGGGEVARLSFGTTDNAAYAGSDIGIDFWWVDCGDNTVSVPTGDTLLFSDQVYRWIGGWQNVTGETPFPSRNGVHDTCLAESGYTTHLRGIDYFGGAVLIEGGPTPSDSYATIRIDKVMAGLGVSTTVGIYIDSVAPGFQFGGFDLLMGYEANALFLQDVQQGSMLDSCDWEYFTYRTGPVAGCNDTLCPSGMLRIVAVADISNGADHPLCYLETGGEIARLDFLTTSNEIFNCVFANIDFWWVDCGDNLVSDPGGWGYLSDHVYQWWGMYHDVTAESSFPTPAGAPSTCLVDSSNSRGIDYYGGGVDLLCVDPIDFRGDVNLNEIAYEIADWVVFSNYFMHGFAALSIDPNAQAEATDVNADGRELTVDDHLYLYRVIIGDATPIPNRKFSGTPGLALGPAADTVFLVQDSGVLALDQDSEIRELFMVFSGELLGPFFNVPEDYSAGYYYDTVQNYTRVMITPGTSTSSLPAPIDDGLFLTFSGGAQLIYAEAALDGLTPHEVVITGANSAACCLSRGNVDNDPDGIVNIVDLTTLIAYAFDGLPQPYCFVEADFNGDGTVNIVDITNLINYLYSGGAPPAPCP